MIIYTVNEGHYPTYKAANDARKKLPYGNYVVFRVGEIYTVRLYSTPRKELAYEMAERLQKSRDVWIEEKDMQKEVSKLSKKA